MDTKEENIFNGMGFQTDAIEQYVHSLIGDVLDTYDYRIRVTHEPNFNVVYRNEITRRAYKVTLTLKSFFNWLIRSLSSPEYVLNPTLYELHKLSTGCSVDIHPTNIRIYFKPKCHIMQYAKLAHDADDISADLLHPKDANIVSITIKPKTFGFGLTDDGMHKYVQESVHEYTIDMYTYKVDSVEVTHILDIDKIRDAIKENAAEVKKLLISQYTQLNETAPHRVG